MFADSPIVVKNTISSVSRASIVNVIGRSSANDRTPKPIDAMRPPVTGSGMFQSRSGP